MNMVDSRMVCRSDCRGRVPIKNGKQNGHAASQSSPHMPSEYASAGINAAHWTDHLPGVWHVNFPSKVHKHLGIQSELLPGEPLKLWINSDGEVSCPVLKCMGSASASCSGKAQNDSV